METGQGYSGVPFVLGVCRRVTGDLTSADDAFQAVFLVLARRATVVKPREQVGNWLYGVAFRTAIKARAVLARRRSREKQVEVMPEPPVPPADAWSDLQPVIDEELARLPDKLRVPVVLCDLEGRAQREVANLLGVPLATLASRLAAARRKLAERLTSRGVTLSGGALAGLLTLHGAASAIPHSLASGLAQAVESIAGGIATSLVPSCHPTFRGSSQNVALEQTQSDCHCGPHSPQFDLRTGSGPCSRSGGRRCRQKIRGNAWGSGHCFLQPVQQQAAPKCLAR